MSKSKPNNKYYIPGIISMIFLPIAFYFFAKREMQKLLVWAIPIHWADTAFMNKKDAIFSNFNWQFPPKRNYLDIVFSGNQKDDNIKLEFAQIRIKEILKTRDTVNGIHFLFTDSANYGTFVETLDRLQIEGAKTYMPLENNLWFYHIQPATTVKPKEFHYLLIDDVIYVEPEVSRWNKTIESVKQVWQVSWQLIVLYCCLVFSIIALRLYNNRI